MSESSYNTPPWFLDLVRKLDHRGIGLDPCSNATSMVQAKTSYTVEDNGLVHSWRGHGLVFMNPPHSKSPNNIEPWMEKAHLEFVLPAYDRYSPSRDSFVGLIPAKTDTGWFHEHAQYFASKCFLKGRMKFWHLGAVTEGNGKFAHLVIYHGTSTGLFKLHFHDLGWIP